MNKHDLIYLRMRGIQKQSQQPITWGVNCLREDIPHYIKRQCIDDKGALDNHHPIIISISIEKSRRTLVGDNDDY